MRSAGVATSTSQPLATDVQTVWESVADGGESGHRGMNACPISVCDRRHQRLQSANTCRERALIIYSNHVLPSPRYAPIAGRSARPSARRRDDPKYRGTTSHRRDASDFYRSMAPASRPARSPERRHRGRYHLPCLPGIKTGAPDRGASAANAALTPRQARSSGIPRDLPRAPPAAPLAPDPTTRIGCGVPCGCSQDLGWRPEHDKQDGAQRPRRLRCSASA